MTELIRLAKALEYFACESTLSGRTYLRLLTGWKTAGYQITIVFLTLTSPQLARQRIASRVRQGGHHIPRADVYDAFNAVGTIIIRGIVHWPMPGRSMTIPAILRMRCETFDVRGEGEGGEFANPAPGTEVNAHV